MMGLIEKWKTGSALSPHAINMAFALELWQQAGLIPTADNDIHRLHTVRFDHAIHGYGKMWMVIKMKDKTRPSNQDVIRILRGETSGEIFAFVPYDSEKMNLVKARINETFVQRLENSVRAALFHVKHTFPQIWHDAKIRLNGLIH